MPNPSRAERFFDTLCIDYYSKVLRALYAILGSEELAHEVVQETFLVAWQKREQLLTHPNPGGFLYLTARNLAKKARKQAIHRLVHEVYDSEEQTLEQPDKQGDLLTQLDRAIDADRYVETVLATLAPEKRRLYTLYYMERHSMAEIAVLLGLEETALRMRYVRLRREIKAIAAAVAEKEFSV